MGEATFWFTLVLSIVILMIPVVAWRFYFVDVHPTLSDRVRLKQRLSAIRLVLVVLKFTRSVLERVGLLSDGLIYFTLTKQGAQIARLFTNAIRSTESSLSSFRLCFRSPGRFRQTDHIGQNYAKDGIEFRRKVNQQQLGQQQQWKRDQPTARNRNRCRRSNRRYVFWDSFRLFCVIIEHSDQFFFLPPSRSRIRYLVPPYRWDKR